MKDIIFRDLFVEGPVDNGILVDGQYRAPNPSCPAGWKPPTLSVMSNYSFLNIDGTKMVASSNVYHFKGQPGAAITDVTLENVTFAAGKKTPQWLCENVVGTAKGVAPGPPCTEIKQV